MRLRSFAAWATVSLALFGAPMTHAGLVGCGAITDQMRAGYARQLDEAQALINQQKYEDATEYLTWGASIRVSGSDYADMECLPDATRQRQFQLRRTAYGEMGRFTEQRSVQRAQLKSRVADSYITGRNLDDVRRVLTNPQDPKLALRAGPKIRGVIERLEYVKGEHGLIPEEAETLGAYTTILNRLISDSRARKASLLEREDGIVTGEITEFESATDQLAGFSDALVESMTGVGGSVSAGDDTVPIMRAGQSLVQLDLARQWTDWIGPDEAPAINSRAVARGDAAMVAARDDNKSLEARSGYFDAAGGYFRLAGADARAENARAGEAALKPALEQQRAQQQAAIKESAEDLKQSAMEFQKSMQKSDAEKQSFKDEAASLEDELGF